ncbi:Queuine tRNA-ribosyltransferase accessory subunit 2 [Gryllus bimaculatus]|nr:Queuine tRNA-ribosyltransferase accessory subunit 2 [Gryllus bimaculatus]
MKFVLCSASKCSRRLGKIIDVQRLPDLAFETPLFFLHSKGGAIPHITHEVLQMISGKPISIQVPVASTLHSEDAVRDFKKGLAEFIGLAENLIYCTVQDSAAGVASGFNDKSKVSVFTRKGRRELDAERYMNVMEAFCPDMYQVLHDGDTDANSGKKRVTKAVDRTSRFTEVCLQRHKSSAVLQNKAILGVIEGGHNISARETSAKEMRDHPFAGFVIDGLCKQGPETENIQTSDIKEIIEKTLAFLPTDKFRIIHGCWNPEVILDLVDMGIDMFDGSYPFIVTERGAALTFCNQIDSYTDCHNLNTPSKETEEENISECRIYEIDLNNKMYFDDLQPVSKTCSCLTCKEHTRAYIHHLLSAKELLGTVLLMIHNIHHYMEFFQTIRRAIKDDIWEDFHKKFKQNLKK